MLNKAINITDDDMLTAFNDETKVTKAIQEGIRRALIQHKHAGNPICEWKDNQVNWIPAEKIII